MIYIEKDLSDKILMVGVYAGKGAFGGMAAVVNSYRACFETFKYIPTWKLGGKLLKAYYAFTALIKFLLTLFFNNKIKIVHIHCAADASYYRKKIFINLACVFGKKVVLHMHACDFKEFFEKRSTNKNDVVKTFNKCAKFIVLSKSWLEYFESIGIKQEKLEVLNNIVLNPISIKKECINDNKLHILFLGEIGKRKGVYDMLQAIIEHREWFEGKVKIKIGGNREEDILRKMISDNHLENMVEFLGWVSGQKKIECLNWADCFMLPSYNEGLPISLLEAMSYGLPIISTPVGGIPEIVIPNKTGYLVNPGDIEAISSALKDMLDNEDKLKIMKAEELKIIQEFYPMNVLSHLKNIYNEALKI